MIIMKRMVFSFSVVRTPYQGRYFYVKSLDRAVPGKLRGAGCAVRLHLRVERGGRESTCAGRVFWGRAGRASLFNSTTARCLKPARLIPNASPPAPMYSSTTYTISFHRCPPQINEERQKGNLATFDNICEVKRSVTPWINEA